MKWAVGTIALWALLATLAEFRTTASLGVALAWAIAGGATLARGGAALDELQRLTG